MRLIDADAIEHCLVIGGRRHGKTIINEIIRRAIQAAPTVNPWKEVYDELTKVNLLCGRYDASHAKDHYMYGVELVMEIIAYHAGMEDEFNDMFSKNMIDSEKRAERKEE